ncbi:hypothetical protein [uncultured Brevundimonas sp.]|uniref:hypothetical protein n=1 Tax=uncultured Brevundimonas sp. TaxID=213418 RepID=UPI0025D3C2F3|nr:hypothetical protein [uncultured Brevundimonas sp.]
MIAGAGLSITQRSHNFGDYGLDGEDRHNGEREHQSHLQKVHLKGLQLSVAHRRSPSLLRIQIFHLERHIKHSLGGDRPAFEAMNPDNKNA